MVGCGMCGVSDRIARHWPAAHAALARELGKTDRREPTEEKFLVYRAGNAGGNDLRGTRTPASGWDHDETPA